MAAGSYHTLTFLNTCTPMKITRQKDALLPSLPSTEQVCDAQGLADTQLSCQRSSNAKPPLMLTQGKTVLRRWKLCSSKKNSLHLFLYQIKSFGNSCLSGWEWELVLRQQKISLSDVSTTNTSHHLRLQGGAFDPFPAPLCLSCCLPSKKSRADTGRKCSVHSWNSNRSSLHGNGCTAHTVPKVSSCAKEQRMGQTTLPEHTERQKQE